MPRIWTDAQMRAITTTDRTLLVSAAAGSGKTATLTERVIQNLTHPDHPVDIDRVLIVTFTKAAASELRQRISDALSEQLAADPKNTRLYRQMLQLSGAHIGTIDSFCLDAVRSHFSEVGFPASLRIADKAELTPICERVMERLIDTCYHDYAAKKRDAELFSLLDENPFADLCDCLTPAKNDEGLLKIFLDLYERLLGFPEGLERLKTESKQLRSLADGDFLASEHGEHLRKWLEDLCRSALYFYNRACDALEADERAAKAYLPAFLYDRQFVLSLREALQDGGFDRVRACMIAYAPLSLKPLKNPSENIVEAKLRRTRYVTEIKEIRQTFFETALPVEDQMRRTGQLCAVLYDFLTRFDREIMEEKRSRGICDFFDVSRLLLGMLQTEDGHPTPLCDEYADRFDQIYIDEYQDVDRVQDRIFSLIGRNHRFMVGDIKQSIYGFRGADPSVFAHYRRVLPSVFSDPISGAASQSTPESGGSIFMSNNFRCDESVIRVSNAICGHCFSACPNTIGYGPEDDLVFSKNVPSPDYTSTRVQIDVLMPQSKADREANADETDGEETPEWSNTECEAAHVANRIAELLRTPTPLSDGHPIRPGDIAVLVRNKSNLSVFSAAMAAMGIPTDCDELQSAEAGQTVLRGRDMMYWMNLLRVIDNPHKDIPLSELCRAPFPGLTLADVVTLRKEGAEDKTVALSMSLYQSMEQYAERAPEGDSLREKLVTFMAWLSEYRRLCSVLSADGLLRMLRQDPRVACRRSKAFRFLYEKARTYRGEAFVDLYTFLVYFERLLLTQKDIKTASGGRDGRVTLMTIHGSKGLEFPVCFLVQCGKSFSAKSTQPDLLFEPNAGVAFKLFDRQNGQKYDTILRQCTALEIKLREREDEMRLLYVAMTRARERLYLCGTGTLETPNEPAFVKGDRFTALSCKNYLGWITSALKEHPEVVAYHDLAYPLLAHVRAEAPLAKEDICAALPAGHTQWYRHILDNRPAENAVDRFLQSIPTKVPASQFNQHLLDSCVFTPGDPLLSLDVSENAEPTDFRALTAVEEAVRLMEFGDGINDFELLLKANQKPTAAEKGTAAHLFLQYCDMQKLSQGDTVDVQGELARLVAKGFISDRTAAIVDTHLLSGFFKSRFFERIRHSAEIGREVRFNRFVPLRDLTDDPTLAERVGDRTLYVQGSIDLLVHYPDGSIELCDYKTDAIFPEERACPTLLQKRFSEKHGAQLAQYALAVRDLYHRLPDRVFIYSFALGEAIEIEIDLTD